MPGERQAAGCALVNGRDGHRVGGADSLHDGVTLNNLESSLRHRLDSNAAVQCNVTTKAGKRCADQRYIVSADIRVSVRQIRSGTGRAITQVPGEGVDVVGLRDFEIIGKRIVIIGVVDVHLAEGLRGHRDYRQLACVAGAVGVVTGAIAISGRLSSRRRIGFLCFGFQRRRLRIVTRLFVCGRSDGLAGFRLLTGG